MSMLETKQDLESGTVIHVGDGKGVSALEGALSKLSLFDGFRLHMKWAQKKRPELGRWRIQWWSI